MGIFSNILDKFRKKEAGAPTASVGGASKAEEVKETAEKALEGINIDAVLKEMASLKGGGGNYKTSIVDLLKLLGLDSSLFARKELAEELNVHAGDHGTAEQNIALHKAVLKKLEENGGIVPDSLKD